MHFAASIATGLYVRFVRLHVSERVQLRPAAARDDEPCDVVSAAVVAASLVAPSAWDLANRAALKDAVSIFWVVDSTTATSQYGHISAWDERCDGHEFLFEGASSFDGDLFVWDVQCDRYEAGVGRADSFNSDLSAWDVSSVTNMYRMFYLADSFTSDLSAWDVSSVTDMRYMFYEASSFTSDLSAWNVSSVTDMSGTFYFASSFNGDLSAWDVSKES